MWKGGKARGVSRAQAAATPLPFPRPQIPNPKLGFFRLSIAVPHGSQAPPCGSELAGADADATSSPAEAQASAGGRLRPRRRCPLLLRLDGPVSCLRLLHRRSIQSSDTFLVKKINLPWYLHHDVLNRRLILLVGRRWCRTHLMLSKWWPLTTHVSRFSKLVANSLPLVHHFVGREFVCKS